MPKQYLPKGADPKVAGFYAGSVNDQEAKEAAESHLFDQSLLPFGGDIETPNRFLEGFSEGEKSRQ